MGRLWLRARVAAPFVAAAALGSLSLRGGLVLGDWVQRAMLEQTLRFGTPWDLFTFARGDAQQMREDIARGVFPWFALPELKIHFLRPLSTLLHHLDLKWLAGSATAAHLHSTAWFLALVAVAIALYRRLLPQGWWLAAMVFALDDAHALPVSWLSNRNAVVACVLGLLALLAHLAWREQGKAWAGALAPTCAALALAAGETAVGVLAFIVARELFGSAEALKARARALLPLATVMLIYLAAYRWLGAGTVGSGSYVDPLHNPVGWLQGLPSHGLVLLGGWTFGLLSSDLWLNLPALRALLIAQGLGAVLAWVVVWRWLRHEKSGEAAALRWLAPGALLACLPGLSTFPSERLLAAPSFGLCAVVAVAGRLAWQQRGWRSKVVLTWFTFAFALQPVALWVVTNRVLQLTRVGIEQAIATSPQATQGRVVLVSTSDYAPGFYFVPALAAGGGPLPTSWHTLSMAPFAHRLVRLDERAIELEVVGGRMLDSAFEQYERDEAHPLAPGATVQLDGLTVRVTQADHGHPTRIRVDLELAPGDYHFVRWDGARLAPIELPPVGGTVELPRAPTLVERGLFAW